MALLKGKQGFITGAARGIGFAAAEALLAEGASVCVSDVDAEALAAAADRLVQYGDRVSTLELDVGSDASVLSAKEQVAAGWTKLDVLVNNAAMLDSGVTGEVALDRWQTVIDTNMTSALRVTQAFLPLLRLGQEQSIINTISTQAFFGQPGSIAYSSAKGGLMSLTRAMAVDLGAAGIRVNAVAPGFIDTRMAVMADGRHEHDLPEFTEFYIGRGRIPLRRAGTPADCAGAFVFLASSMSAYTTGQVIFVDGGLSATY